MTNRMRLLRIANDLQKIKSDPFVGPDPYAHLAKACEEAVLASQYALSYEERGEKIDGFGS